MIETIFRFQNVRPPIHQPSSKTTVDLKIVPVQRVGATKLINQIEGTILAGGGLDGMRLVVDDFKKSATYVGDLDDLGVDIRPFLDWLSSESNKSISDIDIPKELAAICGSPIAEFMSQPEVTDAYSRLSDSLLAGVISETTTDQSQIISSLKILHLLFEVADGRKLANGGISLGTYIDRLIIVLPRDTRPPKVRREELESEKAEKYETVSTRRQLDSLDTAYQQVVDLINRPGSIVVVDTDFEIHRREQNQEDRDQKDIADKNTPTTTGLNFDDPLGLGQNFARIAFDPKAYQKLPEETRQILEKLTPDVEGADPFSIVTQLERMMTKTAGQLASDIRKPVNLRMGNTSIDLDALGHSFGFETFASVGSLPPGSAFLPSPSEVRCQYRAYIDDLLIVKQKLKAYELAEFAHVENVLAGEERTRVHRRLDLYEEVTSELTETETEKERNLQSTDRNEIQVEAERKIKEDSKLEYGLNVSASYGPSLSMQADTKGSFSTAREESQRKAITYSREVTEKASERVRERVQHERTRRIQQEIEETNTHSLSGQKDKHTRGIYRWLNKKYEAQIFEYGQRLMLEFILPEPAAYYLYSMVESPPPELAEPKEPTYEGKPLKPENLTRKNYQDYVAAYQVRSAPQPPSAFIMKSVFEKQDANQQEAYNSYGRGAKVVIPSEYEAVAAKVSGYCSRPFFMQYPSWITINVGDQTYEMYNLGKAYMSFGYPSSNTAWRDEISVSFSLGNVSSFVVAADIMCHLTEIGMRKWQHEVYDAVMESYLSQKSEYEGRIAEETFGGITIRGRNPIENQSIIRDELKRLVITALMNDPLLDMGAYQQGYAEPIVDLIVACANEPWIRFLEQAFEWSNMLYVFYPYFWGRRSRWRTLLPLTDADSDFAAFLKAGAVRIQLPVRPEFNRAVGSFCQTGQITFDSDASLFDDDLYVPIIEEITANLGKPGDEKPYGKDPEPWEVTVPTSLVVVQDIDEIPGIRDILTGVDIDLGGGGG